MHTFRKPANFLPPRYLEVVDNIDRRQLKAICEMHEDDFVALDGFAKHTMPGVPGPENYYYFADRGASVLAVAHLDTVGPHDERTANIIGTADGPVIYSRALDDRLGAYIILDLLPKLGINVDVLLTVGEESGNSTAQHFDPGYHGVADRYQYMIEFDRGGTDVVMYQYETAETTLMVEEAGAEVGTGAFSDISYLSHLGIKGFNWGVAYYDYHYPRAHAWLDETARMVGYFCEFHSARSREGERLVHDTRTERDYYGFSRRFETRFGEIGGEKYERWSADTSECEWRVPEAPELCDGDVFETEYGLLCSECIKTL